MSRAKLQLASVLSILPLGVGLCVLCLGEPAEPERAVVVATAPEARTTETRTTAAAIVAPPLVEAGANEVAERAEPPALAVREDPSESAPVRRDLGEGPARVLEPVPGADALGPELRRALVGQVLDRGLDQRQRLAAVVALAASSERDYVPEVFRAAFPEAPAAEIAPGPISDPASRRALTAALRDPGASVAERALLVAALGPSQGYPEVAAALEEALADPSPEVRGQVVLELAISEEPGAGDLLRRAAEDPSPEVRLRAVLALGADPTQQPALVAAYDLEGQDPEIKAAIVIQASEHAGTPAGAGFLTRVLRDEADPALREQALAALAVAAEADPEGLRTAAGPELPSLLEYARLESGVSASADAERVLEALRG